MSTICRKVLFGTVLLLACFATGFSHVRATETLYFDGDICLDVDLEAPELVDMYTALRFSTKATRGFFLRSTWFELQLPSAEKNVSLSLRWPWYDSGSGRVKYYGHCEFTEGVEGFLQQVDGPGCIVVGQKTSNARVYHSRPGFKDNVRVHCYYLTSTSCSMSTNVVVGQVTVGLHASYYDSPPSSWMPIAEEIREFIVNRVHHLPNC